MVRDDNDDLEAQLAAQAQKQKASTLQVEKPVPDGRPRGIVRTTPIPDSPPRPIVELPASPRPKAPAPEAVPAAAGEVDWTGRVTGAMAPQVAVLRRLAAFGGTKPPELVATTLEVNVTTRVTRRAELACILYDQLEQQGKRPLGVPDWRQWAGHTLEVYTTILAPKMAARLSAESRTRIKGSADLEQQAAALDEGLRLSNDREPATDAVTLRNMSDIASDMPWDDAISRLHFRTSSIAWGATRLYNTLSKNRGLTPEIADWRHWLICSMNVWADAAMPLMRQAGASALEAARNAQERRV